MTRVPITAIGVIAPGAIGIGAFRELLRGGVPVIADVERFDTQGLSAHRAALIRDFNPRDFIAPMKLRRMNALSRLGLSAARLAIRDRGDRPLDPSTGVAIGTAFGPVQTSVEYMQEYVEKGPALAPPQLFAESVANAPGSHIAIDLGLRGFNLTVTQRESSALAAAMHAASQIAKGAAPGALIGGVDEVNEMLFSVLDRLGALAHGEDEGARPFDRRRNGMVIGEGSAVLIAGGDGEPYGYLSGFGIARDTSATVSDFGERPEAIEQAMRAAIDDADIEPGDIGAIYASANSAIRPDRMEATAIRSLFGEKTPVVVATKGYFGEYAGGGAFPLVAALLALRDQAVHASAGYEERDPSIAIEPNREYRPLTLQHVLVNSISAGGGIVSAVVSREAR